MSPAEDPSPLSRPATQTVLLVALFALVAAGVAGLALAYRQGPGERAAGGGTISGAFTDAQKKDIGLIAREYLIANPEVFIEVRTALEQKEEKREAEEAKKRIAENAKELYRHPNVATGGNPDGDITVAEFFDYNCGYCKYSFPDLAKLVEKDPKVRLVLLELPIVNEASEPVARIALAAQKQGKYFELHRVLIRQKGLVNEEVALAASKQLGLDMDKLKADMNAEDVKAEIERIKALARTMNVNGTPHFLVGDKVINGGREDLYDVLAGHIAELRKTGCSYC